MDASKMSATAVAVAEQCGSVVAAAVNAENSVRHMWAKAGKALFKAGARVEFLTRGTKDAPNPDQDDSLIETVEKMIVDALTMGVKPLKFGTESFTVGALLALTREELRDLDNAVLSQTRRYWRQQVGSLFGLVRRYVDRVQNPDKVRGVKAKGKDDAKAATMPETWQAAIQFLSHLQAKTATMPVSEGGQLLSAKEVADMQDALASMLAVLRRHVK